MTRRTVTSLTDRYEQVEGRVLLSGIQALVRLPLDQMRRDRENGLNTGTFISGYRGSPLGGYDLQLGRNRELLQRHNIRFQPGVNEELAATAVWGSQQVNLFDGATVDGVCGIWYGKTPGVDRSTDAFRHGNAAGSSPHGGVLVVAGDDHGCKSSSYPGQSEFAFVDMHMPVLNPASVQEVLDYGHFGLALSRFSGCWVAMITLAENMDSSATVNVDPDRLDIAVPPDFELPQGGLNIRIPDTPLEQEERLWRYKRPAALAFCRHNRLNRVVLENADARLGIVTAGKAHLDLLQALENLGIDEDRARALGIRILKVGMTYPLDVAGIREFARDLDQLLVVEEKRSLMEVQLKEELYNVELRDPHFPRILGKTDEWDRPLLPTFGELSPEVIEDVLLKLLPGGQVARRAALTAMEQMPPARIESRRAPFFCSGCPHNTSTRVPEGSRALAGIGCHYLVQTMNRDTWTFTQMGGEGVSWIGQAGFTETPHVFVNLGDGTYFHSGILAIRAAVAAGVNVTYKILYNGAVAMTGGQPHDGELRPDMIASQVLAEGVSRVVWVMEDVHKYRGVLDVPRGVEVRHRDDMDAVQRELREQPGVTCILYDQMCATELRRKRKRGLAPKADERVLINDLVCEGCGDCSVQSNCIAVEPVETEFGTKRRINQTSCNQDMSCVKGFCPSFVTVSGGRLRRRAGSGVDFEAEAAQLRQPDVRSLEQPWSILVTGVGGTGVVTVGALLAMAAYIEGRAVTTLDQTGLAQKGGAVYSHIRIAKDEHRLHSVRISAAAADALLACDLVAAGAVPTCLSRLQKERTLSLVNTDVMPTSAFVMGQSVPEDDQAILDAVESRSRSLWRVDAQAMTRAALGETTTANIFLLGYAWQQGFIPLALDSLLRALELNGVAVADNRAAFSCGRLAAADGERLRRLLGDTPQTLYAETGDPDAFVARREQFLTQYQNAAYGARYRRLVERVGEQERAVDPTSNELTLAVARNAFKLMAYKDEYEVARLYTEGSFRRQLEETFEGDISLTFHLAPPLLTRVDPDTGVARKKRFGGWMLPLFRVLAPLKFLRGTPLDVFGWSSERRHERALIRKYEATVDVLLGELSPERLAFAVEIASLPGDIRGFGHVKMRNIEQVCGIWREMLAQYRAGALAWDKSSSTRGNAVRQFEPGAVLQHLPG